MKYSIKTFILPIIDIGLLTICYFFSLSIIGEKKIFQPNNLFSLILYIAITVFFLNFSKTYKSIWKYNGVQEVMKVLIYLTFSILIYTLYFFLFLDTYYPITLLATIWLASVATLITFRLFYIIKSNSLYSVNTGKNPTLILGAGVAGTIIARQIIQTKELDFQPIGFIDDDPNKHSMEIYNIPVLGPRSRINHIVDEFNITDIIISMPSVESSVINELIQFCKETKVKVWILPPVREWIQGESSLTKLKEINVKELIGRESIHYTNQITDYLSNKIVLITGAGGSIGSELVKQVARVKPKSLILVGRGENSIFNVETMIKKEFPQIEVSFFIADIQDKYLMQRIFKMHKPEVVFHAAAHKHVPLMENNVEAAICNNVFGTRNVVELSSKYGVERFVFISTDKAVHPVNIMGMTKRLGELITLNGADKSSTKFSIVRFGNVIDSRGSVIPILKKQIESGGPVTVTHPEMVRYFMTIPEAVHLVLEAGSLSKGGEIFVLKMGKPIKIVELAENLIQLYGYTPYKDIEVKFTGIRPGEKLYEVLFYDSENIRTTNHPNIVIAEPLYKIENLNLKDLEDVSKLEREEIKELLLQTINKNI